MQREKQERLVLLGSRCRRLVLLQREMWVLRSSRIHLR
jgi:hypothetical protein